MLLQDKQISFTNDLCAQLGYVSAFLFHFLPRIMSFLSIDQFTDRSVCESVWADRPGNARFNKIRRKLKTDYGSIILHM